MILKPEIYKKIVQNMAITFRKLEEKPKRFEDLVQGLGKILSFNELDRLASVGRKYDSLLCSIAAIYCYLQDTYDAFNQYIRKIRKEGNKEEKALAQKLSFAKLPKMNSEMDDKVLVYSNKNKGIILGLTEDKRQDFMLGKKVDDYTAEQVIRHYIDLSVEIIESLISCIKVQDAREEFRDFVCNGINIYSNEMAEGFLLRPVDFLRKRHAQGKAISSFFNAFMCGVPEKCVFRMGKLKLVSVKQ